MLRRLGIRGKVLAALSVPVLVLFLLAGIVSLQSIQDVQTKRANQAVIDALESVQQIVEAMQTERAASLPTLGGARDEAVDAMIEDVQADTDAMIARFQTYQEKINFDALDPTFLASFDDFNDQLAGLRGPRNYVSIGAAPVGAVDTAYSNMIDTTLDFYGEVAGSLEDRGAASFLTFEYRVLSLVEAYRHEMALGTEVIKAGGRSVDAERLATYFGTANELRLDLYRDLSGMGLDATFTEVLIDDGPDSYDRMRKYIESATNGLALPSTLTPETWVAAAEDEIDLIRDASTEAHRKAVARADAVEASSFRGAILTIALVVGGVVLSVVTALSIAGGIVRPLRRLTVAAGTVRDELPNLVEQVAIPGQGPDLRLTRIPVTSRDEIGRLAAAFNEVNATTIEVAQEQAALRASIAEMFVNVARRDQVLLNRQLSFIDALERSEENPKILADLFRLDHLATRMRRNAESLLVLAGIDTGRRLRESLPTSDVIRTASSEIEHYERIQLDLPVDPLMLGHTALPAAHMLAELLENATVFSDPGTPVYVSTGIDQDAVIITIQDQGLGMLPEELEMANAKIATTSASDVLGSQRLGLYVVGRIASRLGTTVTLSKGPDDKGTLATVRMPLVLFVNPSSIPITAPSQRQVESFVRPEEAAAVVHDTAYAPAPVGGVQDVAAGALGSAENPAEAVDIAALVEGTTELGLPKRRSHGTEAPTWDMTGGDTAAASAIPLAPSADSLAGAAAAVQDEVWQPPMVATSTPLVTRKPGETPHAAPSVPAGLPGRGPATGGLPTRSPATTTGGLPIRTSTGSQPPVPQSLVGGPTQSGLPARRPSGPGGPTAPEAVSTASATGPANVEGRTAMFAGFRSRRAELQAAAVQEAGAEPAIGSDDAVERLAAAATSTASFFRRSDAGAPAADKPADEPMVIPALVDDDDEFGDGAFAPDAPAPESLGAAPAAAPAPSAPADEKPWAPQWQAPAAPEAQPWQPQWSTPEPAEQAAPVQPWQPQWSAEPVAEPVAEAPAPVQQQPAAPEAEPAWQPRWATPELQQAAAPAAEPVAAPVAEPVAEAPAWQPPTFAPAAEPVAPVAPVAPVVPALEPEPAAEAQPWAPAPGPWVTSEPDTPAEPVAAPAAAAAAAPVFQPPVFGGGAPTTAPAASEAFGYQSSINFAELVQGPSRRSLREKKRRGGLFRRRKETPAPTSTPTPAPAFTTPVTFGPPAPAVGAVATPDATGLPPFAPVVEASPATPAVAAPSRQSAWGAPVGGSHAVAAPEPEPSVPAWQPPTFGAPVEEAPSPAVPALEPEEAWAPTFAPTPDAEVTAPMAPAAPTVPAPAAAPAAGGWQPASGWSEPDPEAWPARQAPAAPAAPTPAAAAPAPSGLPSRGSAAPAAGATSFTPQPMFGFDDEMTSMLAQRADIAQQALAELNQLSMYRPQAVATSAPSALVRRTPTAIPAAPAIATSSSAPRPARDANQVRSLLSSFQSGTSRGRQGADGDGAPTNTGDDGLAGSEEGPMGHGEPVTTPDTDLTTRDTPW